VCGGVHAFFNLCMRVLEDSDLKSNVSSPHLNGLCGKAAIQLVESTIIQVARQ